MSGINFKPLANVEQRDAIKFLFCNYFAVDETNRLCLSTTNGRTRNARRWFVHRYDLPSGRTDWQAGKITFRAWTSTEAIERLKEPQIQRRIRKQFGIESEATK